MSKAKIGLLGLYLELYDNAMPERRAEVAVFYDTIASELTNRGVEVVTADLCRVKSEFRDAVSLFEHENVDAIVTLHLAYSPSLECADILAKTNLPLIVLDTTIDFEFSSRTKPDRIMYNHGIHGVMDMCNLLIRKGKPFVIEAGHFKESDVIDRAVSRIGDAEEAGSLASGSYEPTPRRGSSDPGLKNNNEQVIKVGLIGEQFKGMGDFQVDFEILKDTFNIEVIQADPNEIASLMPGADDPEVETEISDDLERFETGDLEKEAHLLSVRTGLSVQRWIKEKGLSAFSMNFLSVDSSSGLAVVPFLEASKAMARGIGYAGEGDVLTASFIGMLMERFPETTFTEMFCPDWKNGSVFLSHMGEVNVDLIDGKAKLVVKPFPWTDASDPVVAVGRLKPGKGVFVDIAPGRNDEFALICAPGTIEGVEGEDLMAGTVHGWFKPEIDLPGFLEHYSMHGGTHHSAFVYDGTVEKLRDFAQLMGLKMVVL
ncbi:hypothetical protein ACFL6F_02530 [Planctomycetota bacterium]